MNNLWYFAAKLLCIMIQRRDNSDVAVEDQTGQH